MQVPLGALLDLLLRVLYLAALLTALGAGYGGRGGVRQLCLILSPLVLALWVGVARRRHGPWANARYAYGVLTGLLLLFLGELALSQPVGTVGTYPGLLALATASLAFAAALSAPTALQPVPPKAGDTVSSPRSAWWAGPNTPVLLGVRSSQVYRVPRIVWAALGVPFAPLRALLPLAALVAALAGWAVGASASSDPRFLPAAAYLTVHAVLVWRAIARVGYRAPLVTALRMLRSRAVRLAFGSGRLALFNAPSPAATPPSSSPGGGGFSVWSSSPRPQPLPVGGESGAVFTSEAIVDEAWEAQVWEEEGEAAEAGRAPTKTGKRASTAPVAARAASTERTARLRGGAVEELLVSEEREVQWGAVAGAITICVGNVAIAVDRLWLLNVVDSELPGAPSPLDPVTNGPPAEGFPATASTAYFVLHVCALWLGCALLARSVPTRYAAVGAAAERSGASARMAQAVYPSLGLPLPPVVSLEDTAVNPAGVAGQSLRVLVILPGSSGAGADAAELAVYWHLLRRRGHTVVFATRAGWRGVQTPAAAAGSGASKGGGGSGRRGGGEGGASTPAHPPPPSYTSLTGIGFAPSPHIPVAHRRACCSRGRDGGWDEHWATAVSVDAYAGADGGPSPINSRGRGGGLTLPARGGVGGAAWRMDSDVGVSCGRACPNCCGLSSLALPVFALGAPGPLLTAMYAELLRSVAFRRPLAWTRSGCASVSDGIESVVDVETFDGCVLVGRHADAGGEEEEEEEDEGGEGGEEEGGWRAGAASAPDAAASLLAAARTRSARAGLTSVPADLQAAVRAFWASGRPIAASGTAVGILAGCYGRDGRPLLAGSDGKPPAAVACTPPAAEWSYAILLALSCRPAALGKLVVGWEGSGRRKGGSGPARVGPTLYDRVVAAAGDPSRVLTGPGSSWSDVGAWLAWLISGVPPSGLLCPPQPRPEADGGAFIVAPPARALITGRGGADAFALTRAFITQLEESARVY